MRRYIKLPTEEIVKIDFTQSWAIAPNMVAVLIEKSLNDVTFSEDGKTGQITYDTFDLQTPHTYSYISPETGTIVTHIMPSGVNGRPLFYNAATMTEVTQDEIDDVIAGFPDWVVGELFALVNGALPVIKRKYNNRLYLVVQPHTSQADWTPDIVKALYREIIPEQFIAPWKPYNGTASTIYQPGNKVTYGGFTWQSTVADNVWAPGVYGWVKI